MKNLKKIIVSVLAFTFLTSSLVLTSSAAFLSGDRLNGGYSVTWNQNCTNGQSQNSNCPPGFDGTSFGQYSYQCPTSGNGTGGFQYADPSSGNCTWSNASIESFLNAAKQAAGYAGAADEVAQVETPAADTGSAEDTYTAADPATTDTTAKQAATAADETAVPATQEPYAPAESDSASTAPTNCGISGIQTIIGNCNTASDTGSTVSGNTLANYLNKFLAKCGIDLTAFGISLPDFSGTPETPATQTPAQETPAPAKSSAPETSTPVDTGSSDTNTTADAGTLSFEEQVAALVNEQRAANGLSPLTLNAKLSDAARAKSQDMHDNNYFSHTSPTYGSPFAMLTAFGISYSSAGENIAMGYATPEAVMEAWMNSSGHRANILNASYTQIGVGYVADGNYWTQEFIG